MTHRSFPALLAAVTSLLLAACEPGEQPHLVGTLERDRIELAAELSEPVIELHAREGARVQQGDLLLQLDDRRARAERDRLAAQRDQARRRLDELVRGPRRESILEARAGLSAAQGRLETAQREFERARELHEQDLASAATLDTARAARDTAAGERDAARAALDAQLEGATVEELDQARAALAAAEAALRGQEMIVERLSVQAPRDARVEALPWKPGSQPPRGSAVAVLLADGMPYARVHVPANLRDAFPVNSTVTVRVPGYGDHPGRVRWVSADAAFTPYFALTEHDRDRLSHVAEIELDSEGAIDLPTGVPVEIHPGQQGAVK